MKHSLTLTLTAVAAMGAAALTWAAPALQAGSARGAAGQDCLLHSAQQVTLSGKVSQLTVPERGSRAGAVQFTLDGRTVRLGPSHYLDANGMRLADGDLVTVTGWTVTKDGASVVIARDLTRAGQTLQWRSSDGAPMWTRGPGMGQGAQNGQAKRNGQGNGIRDRKRDGSCVSSVSLSGGMQLARRGNGQGSGQGNGSRDRKRDGSCGLTA